MLYNYIQNLTILCIFQIDLFHSANCELADVNNQKKIKDIVQFKDEKKQC